MGRSDNNDMSFQSMANIGTTPPSLGLCILSLKQSWKRRRLLKFVQRHLDCFSFLQRPTEGVFSKLFQRTGEFFLSLSLSLVLLFEASWMFEFTARIMNNREIQFVGGGGRIDDRRSFRIEYCRVKTFCLRGWTEYFLFPFWNFTYILFFSGFVYYYCYYFFFFFEKKTKFLQLNLTLFFFFYFLILSLLDSVGCNL